MPYALQLGREGTRNTAELVNALHQNASAYIKAKLEYVGKDGQRRNFEFGSTRYAVVMIGESLPDGTRAEAVYIVLNPLFHELLRNAKRRPLDYEYLRELPPAAQRWYELVSFQIFAALNNNNDRAKYHYSELCARAPITRLGTWEQAKKQLYKIHRPHLQSGYIEKVEFEEIIDEGRNMDWVMWYTPGPKACLEFKEFMTKRATILTPIPTRPRLVGEKEEGKKTGAQETTSEDSILIEKLISFGIDESRAARLVESDRTECELWSNAWPHQNQKGMENPPGVLIKFIERRRRPLPKGYIDAIEKEQRAQEAVQKKERDKYREKFIGAYHRYLRPQRKRIKRAHPDEYKRFSDFIAGQEQALRNLSARHRENIELGFFEDFIEERPELCVLTFWQWARGLDEGMDKNL